MRMPPMHSLLWFRKGLRLHDNPSLLRAVDADRFYAVFCLDPWFIRPEVVGVNRLSFLLESLTGALSLPLGHKPALKRAGVVATRLAC